MSPLLYKFADQPWEHEAIHRLNHRTFAEEIPQHATRPDGVLVDRFHGENKYLICLCGSELVGMLVFRTQRPFSLDQKVPDMTSLLPAHERAVELRLLAVEPKWRHRRVFGGLLEHAVRWCVAEGVDLAVMSGTTRQLALYRHLGFTPFAGLVGTPGALYQPMFISPAHLLRTLEGSRWARSLAVTPPRPE